MNWDTKNYLRDDEENGDDLENTWWEYNTGGVELKLVSWARERVSRSQSLLFRFEDTSGLGQWSSYTSSRLATNIFIWF